MTQHDSSDAQCNGRGASEPATSVPAAEDLTSLLDLHRRGVIDDAQFAVLSHNLAGNATTCAPEAVRPNVPTGRGAGGWLPRHGTALLAGVAVLVLSAGGISWAVLPDRAGSSVELASADAAEEASAAQEPSVDPMSVPTAVPSSSSVAPAPSPAAPDELEQETEPATSSGDFDFADSSEAPPAPPVPAVALPPVAKVAPVPAPTAPAPVDCRAYSYAKEDNRIRYEAELANTNIEFNMALNTGQLDEAAALQSAAAAIQQQWALDDARLASQHPGC